VARVGWMAGATMGASGTMDCCVAPRRRSGWCGGRGWGLVGAKRAAESEGLRVGKNDWAIETGSVGK
jgi:hypothetical protein